MIYKKNHAKKNMKTKTKDNMKITKKYTINPKIIIIYFNPKKKELSYAKLH